MNYRDMPITEWGRWLMVKRARQTLAWANATVMLEIGPGRGVLAGEACADGIKYWALDDDPDVLSALPLVPWEQCIHGHMPNVRLAEWMDGERVGFDAIVAEAVLEHMADHDAAVMFISKCRQWLRMGGRLILRFPEIRFHHWSFWQSTPDHQYVTSLPRVVTLLIAEHFDIVEAGYFLEAWTGWRAHVLWRLTQLVPTRLLHRLSGHAAWEKSVWSKLGQKMPMGYVIARKPVAKKTCTP